jgi:hypothetical protein
VCPRSTRQSHRSLQGRCRCSDALAFAAAPECVKTRNEMRPGRAAGPVPGLLPVPPPAWQQQQPTASTATARGGGGGTGAASAASKRPPAAPPQPNQAGVLAGPTLSPPGATSNTLDGVHSHTHRVGVIAYFECSAPRRAIAPGRAAAAGEPAGGRGPRCPSRPAPAATGPAAACTGWRPAPRARRPRPRAAAAPAPCPAAPGPPCHR